MRLRGSKWRRWDLHIHTPGTVLEDRFESWASYLDAIEAQSDVVAIGITDYLSIDNYSRVRREKFEGRLSNVELIIPNIEFRMTPETRRGQGINIHLLISPDDPMHEAKIRDALTRLCFVYRDDQYACTPQRLADLGRAIDPSIIDNQAAIQRGTDQFKVEFRAFSTWLQKEAWLSRNSIVVTDGGSQGLSGIDQQGDFAAVREEISRFSHAVFSARPGERDFWLGVDPAHRARMLDLGGPKPCLHGSDAHAIEKLFAPDGDRFCWIKADTTFEGLRQVIFEPEERVHIGPTPPTLHDRTRVIDSIEIDDPAGWFAPERIPLNPGLVAIIGPKGSGKSALAEVIAHAGGHDCPTDKASFLDRADPHLDETKVSTTTHL